MKISTAILSKPNPCHFHDLAVTFSAAYKQYLSWEGEDIDLNHDLIRHGCPVSAVTTPLASLLMAAFASLAP